MSRATDSFEEASRAALDDLEEEQRLANHSDRLDSLLRRAGRPRHTRMDGLGDRERSPEVAAWDTLLSSITPDPQAPSAGSSFASSAAAAASSGPASVGTSMTSHEAVSVHGPGDSAYDVCEASDAHSGDEDEDEDADMLELRELDRPLRNSSRSISNALLAEQVARYNHSTDTERNPWEGEGINGLQQIIAGLSERDDVPDSWWEMAGVSRNPRRDPST